jgi:hypothetical protein
MVSPHPAPGSSPPLLPLPLPLRAPSLSTLLTEQLEQEQCAEARSVKLLSIEIHGLSSTPL